MDPPFPLPILREDRRSFPYKKIMAFDPTTEEWVALYVFLTTGAIVWVSFVLSASAFHWREWYSRASYKPWFLWGELLGFLYCAAWILIPVGGFLAWREGFRSDDPVLVPSSGNTPSDSNFFLFNLFYVLFWGLSVFGGPAFFTVGMQMKWPGLALLVSLGILALAGLTTVWAFLIWWVAGVLIVIGAAVVLYAFIVCAAIWYNLQSSGGYEEQHDPFGRTHAVVYLQQQQHQGQVSVQGSRTMFMAGVPGHESNYPMGSHPTTPQTYYSNGGYN